MDDQDDVADETVELDEPAAAPPSPYRFDSDDVPAAASILDVAFANLIDGWEGWGAVDEAATAASVPVADPCVRALWQLAARPLRLVTHRRPGAELVVDGGAGLPAVKEVDADEVRLWEALVDAVTAPAAIARVSDLLFARRSGDVGAHARRAVLGYLDAVGAREDDLNTTTYLLRAWTISRLIKASELEAAALDQVERRVEAVLTSEGMNRPGVFHPLLQVLCEPPTDPARVLAVRKRTDALLTALAAVESRSHLAADIASMRRKLAGRRADAGVIVAIDADEVAGYVRNAEAANHPAARMSHLEAAARVATRRGLTAQAKAIAAQMQQIRPEDLGLQLISTSSSLPIWVPETYLEGFTRHPHWRPGIELFLLIPEPPSGSLARHRESMAGTRSPLRRLFPDTILGLDGLPRATLTTTEERDRHDLALSSRIHAEYQGRVLAIALTRIADKYGVPPLDDLTTLILDLGAGDARLARSLAKGFHYFWAGDYEAATAVVVPKIEAAARSLLRALDEGIYRVQVEREPGGYPGLYVLLNELEKLALDEDWVWFLRWLLLGPIGANIRNEVAHGFLSDLRPDYVALVLRAAAVLITAAPIADDLGRRVDLPPHQRPLTGTTRIADRALASVSNASTQVHALAQRLRMQLRHRPRAFDEDET